MRGFPVGVYNLVFLTKLKFRARHKQADQPVARTGMPEELSSSLLATTRSKNFPGTSSNHNVVVNWMLKVSTGM